MESPLHSGQQAAALHAALNEHAMSPSACLVSAVKRVGHEIAIQPAIPVQVMCVMRACQAGCAYQRPPR